MSPALTLETGQMLALPIRGQGTQVTNLDAFDSKFLCEN